MFFLPLPFNKTCETLSDIEGPVKSLSSIASPQLYILVNGKPTKANVVWHSLVNVCIIACAILDGNAMTVRASHTMVKKHIGITEL